MHSFVCGVIAAAGLALGAGAEPADNPVFPPEAALESLFQITDESRDAMTEGPTASPDGGIYFSDIPGSPDQQTTIHRFDPRAGKTTVFTSKGSKANGLAFDARGRLLVCDGANGGGRALVRWDLGSGDRMLLAGRFEGKRLNSPNDLCVDRHGRIYFTDPRYGGNEPIELKRHAVYVYEPGAGLAELTHDVQMPNGIALSPDERTLYVDDYDSGGADSQKADGAKAGGAEAAGARVYAFPLGEDGRIAGERRTLVDAGHDNNCDGLTVDSDGNVYVTCRDPARPGLLVVDPAGKRLAFLPTGPANQDRQGKQQGIPSNVEFGVGPDSHSLYLTIDAGFYRVRTSASGAPRVWESGRRGR